MEVSNITSELECVRYSMCCGGVRWSQTEQNNIEDGCQLVEGELMGQSYKGFRVQNKPAIQSKQSQAASAVFAACFDLMTNLA